MFYATSSVLAPDVSIKAPTQQNLLVTTLLNLSWPEQFSAVILAHPWQNWKSTYASERDKNGKFKQDQFKENTLSAFIKNKQAKHSKAKHLGIPGNQNQPNLFFLYKQLTSIWKCAFHSYNK